jgi:S1 RNA binding domain protein
VADGRNLEMLFEVGSIAKGSVTKVVPYGAIVRLEGGKTGLVHISEIANAFVRSVSDYINEGDPVLVKVIGISNQGRYELSLKRVPSDEYARHDLSPPALRGEDQPSGAVGPTAAAEAPRVARPTRSDFEKKLSDFLKESEERLAPLRAAASAKRGRRKPKKSASSSGTY